MNKFFDEFKCNPYEVHFNSKNLLDIKEFSNTIILDLFDVFSSIAYHDFYTKRDENVDNRYKLKIKIPVNNYEAFKRLQTDFNTLVSYMTSGENWEISFVKEKKRKKVVNFQLISNKLSFDSISLLSGGLDSFSGAYQEKENRTLFISFYTKDEIKHANFIYEKLIKDSKKRHVIIPKMYLKFNPQYTQRTRTLIFLASCFIYAQHYNVDIIKIYENGIMSLNPTFYFRRVTTKTTHPKTIFYINKILKDLGISFQVENPFIFLTKGEVLNLLPEKWWNYIGDTITCSKNLGIPYFANKKKGQNHCGVCTACLLRQISMSGAKLIKYDANYLVPANSKSLKFIEDIEKNISKPGKENEYLLFAKYKYIEKKSLLEYYKRYLDLINNGEIFEYIDINPKYFKIKDSYNRINQMLTKFSKELEKYFERLE